MWSLRRKDDDALYELLPNGEMSESRRAPHQSGHHRLPIFRGRRTVYLLVASATFFLGGLALLFLDAIALKRPDGYDAVLRYLWPIGLPDRMDNWENENSKGMRALFTCMAEGNCAQNQTSIVLLSSPHFKDVIAGHTSGEDIWAMSILLSLREMGYTTIYAPHNYELARTYRQYPHLVKAIILAGSDAHKCFADSKCIKTPSHPLGIPVWKMFSFHYWTGGDHPLGSPWTLSPENYPLLNPKNSGLNFYLGYSIERTCMTIPFTPAKDRPMQAYILSKQTSYLTQQRRFSWSKIKFNDPPFPLTFIAGMRNSTDGSVTIPEGWHNLGQLNKTQFFHQLERSRVLVGIGSPTLSPSPYDALCMGLPFINPIFSWAKDNPDDRSEWEAQHNGLKYEDPPYVYNVRKDDEEGFWSAIRSAIDNPIPRYIVPNMTMDALKHRIGMLVEGDWRAKAEMLLAERKSSGKGRLFEL
ncbi:hypothetical protein ONZ45_g11674 [Pleurotus djamor]|nr:hypothetical protein ONZ45_g11674 [Pleurotus djamor]